MKTPLWIIIVASCATISICVCILQSKQSYLYTCIPQGPEKLAETIQTTEGVTCVYIHSYGKHYFMRKAT